MHYGVRRNIYYSSILEEPSRAVKTERSHLALSRCMLAARTSVLGIVPLVHPPHTRREEHTRDGESSEYFTYTTTNHYLSHS
jgi:hypothetical protein